MVDEEIRAGWEQGRETWRTVTVTEDAFSRYIDALGGPRTHLADLYLACACAARDPAAIAAFDAAFSDDIHAVVTRATRSAIVPEDIRQLVHERLFVGSEESPPRIREYTGRGELRSWVRVIASRAAVKAAVRSAREEPFEAESLAPMLGVSTDPELDYLRRLYLEELRGALADAFGELSVRERNLLRHAFIEGLTVDAIGALYRVHRATSARWVVAAHALLVTKTKAALRTRLDVSEQECESILRMLQSQCDITLDRYLKPE